MLEEIDINDFFIINACIKNMPYELIARTLKMDMDQFNLKLESLKKKGFDVYPGMEGTKLISKDMEIYNRIIRGESDDDIEIALKLKGKSDIYRTIRKIDKLRSGKPNDVPKKETKAVTLSQEIQYQIIEWRMQGIHVSRIAKMLNMHPNTFESFISNLVKCGNADPRLVELWKGEDTWIRKRKPVEEPSEEVLDNQSEDFEI